MSFHNEIKKACAEAVPAILRASEGSEADICNLHSVIAELMSVLIKDDSIIDSLENKGIIIKNIKNYNMHNLSFRR